MNTTFTLSSIGGIVAALLLFIVLKRVVGFVFRLILAGVLVVAIMLGAWWWSGSGNSAGDNANTRPRRTQTR